MCVFVDSEIKLRVKMWKLKRLRSDMGLGGWQVPGAVRSGGL